MWQLTIICSNGILYGQTSSQTEQVFTEIKQNQLSGYTFVEIADSNSNTSVFVEEILEEEIHPSETISVQLIQHLTDRALFYYSVYLINSSRSFLIPPERLV